MGLSRSRFTREFKMAAIGRLEQGVSIEEVARALEVSPNVLQRWRREFRQGPGNAFPGLGRRRWAEGRVAELERKIGQQAVEIDFLKGCLQRIDEQRKLQARDGKPRSGRRLLRTGTTMPLDTSIIRSVRPTRAMTPGEIAMKGLTLRALAGLVKGRTDPDQDDAIREENWAHPPKETGYSIILLAEWKSANLERLGLIHAEQRY